MKNYPVMQHTSERLRNTEWLRKTTNDATQTSFKICTLDEALEYQNDDVVYRFTTLWNVSCAAAQDLFIETKKWLWLCANSGNQRLAITTPLLIIDEMWHNFILFSQDYTEYCHQCFGRYIHHVPTNQSEKEAHKKKREADSARETETEIQAQIFQFSLIHQKLGIETLLKWYVEYPEQYSEEFFQRSYKSVDINSAPFPEMKKIVDLFKAGKLVIRHED